MIVLNAKLLSQAMLTSGLLLVISSTEITSILYISGQLENATGSNQSTIQPLATSCPQGSILLLNGTCAAQSAVASCPQGSILLLNGTCAAQSAVASCPQGSILLLNGTCAAQSAVASCPQGSMKLVNGSCTILNTDMVTAR